ncbi:MAG TPA: potassium-transporting ATPase subunit KdpC [Actinomycetota bacterium]
MRRSLIAALRMLVVLTVLLGIAYPLVITGIGQGLFKDRADGSFVESNGTVVGSSLIGQSFEGPEWFIGRPDAYDPAASAPSNLGPTNPELGKAVEERIDAISAADAPTGAIPVDAVTSGSSGLDPHISPAYAALQAPRVAEARGLDLDRVLALIEEHTEGRTFGFLGEPRVNVLSLNLALEGLASQT